LERKADLKFFESVLIHKLCETKLGDLLAEKSKLKEEDIEELDRLIKEGLFKRFV
jgi:predicted transcriptional regulator